MPPSDEYPTARSTEDQGQLIEELAALRETEERYRMIFDHMDETVYILKASGGDLRTAPVEFVSSAVNRLGYSADEFVEDASLWFRSIHPDDIPAVGESTRTILETGQAGTREYRLRHKETGEYRWVEDRVIPQLDDAGEVTGVIGVARDVTERKRAEQKLQMYQSMVSASSDLMVFVDPTYTYRAVNAAYCDALGTTQEEILGHTVVSVLGQKLFETLKPKLDGCLAGGQTTFEFWWDSPALGRRHVDTRYDPFYEADGSVSGVLVDIRDDTERQYTQEELGKSRERLRNLAARLQSVREEERTTIAREMHDELGQALTGVRMDLAWLTEKLPRNRKALLERARSMTALVDSTLETVRQIAWRLRPAILDDLGLQAAVEWQVEEFESRTGLDCALAIDAGAAPLDPVNDTVAFRILQEALTNVARHAEASRVNISLRVSNGQLVLEVRDDGKGITDRDLASTAALGLIGMRERAAPLGGRVTVRRVEEGGTEVKLTLAIGAKEGS